MKTARVSGYVKTAGPGATKQAMTKKTKAEELTALFYQTPEMKECRETADAIANQLDPEDTVAVTIGVPKAFIRLTDFLEGKRAADAGGAPLPAETVLSRILINELHDQLHWLITSPARYSHYRDLWNRFCEAQGAPEEKISDGTATAKSTEEGPF